MGKELAREGWRACRCRWNTSARGSPQSRSAPPSTVALDGLWHGWVFRGVGHRPAGIRHFGVQLAGPIVTDLETLYNVAILSECINRAVAGHPHQQPVQRARHQRRFDHRILGLAGDQAESQPNKKARLLKNHQRIRRGRTGVACRFLMLPRIQRILPDGEQKQADYLARYSSVRRFRRPAAGFWAADRAREGWWTTARPATRRWSSSLPRSFAPVTTAAAQPFRAADFRPAHFGTR